MTVEQEMVKTAAGRQLGASKASGGQKKLYSTKCVSVLKLCRVN